MCPSDTQISSNSDEKPPPEQPPLNVTSPSSDGQFSTYSSAEDVTQTQSPIDILDSAVTVSHSGQIRPTGDNILGRTCAAAGTSALGELRPPRSVKGCTNWYDMCTESLGFESLAEKMDVFNNLPAEGTESSSRTPDFTRSRTTRTCGLMREKTESKVFPPPLSTLDSSGRSRFNLERVRTDDGRLTIVMVERNWPAIVRTSSDEGGILLKLVTERDEEDDVKNEEQHEDANAANRASGSPP